MSKKKQNKDIINQTLKKKINELYNETVDNGNIVSFDYNITDTLKAAKSSNLLMKVEDDIDIYPFLFIKEDHKYIGMIFKLKLPGTADGNSTSSKIIIDLVKVLEHTFKFKKDFNMRIETIKNYKKSNVQCLYFERIVS